MTGSSLGCRWYCEGEARTSGTGPSLGLLSLSLWAAQQPGFYLTLQVVLSGHQA